MSLVKMRKNMGRLKPLLFLFFVVFVVGILLQFNASNSGFGGDGSRRPTVLARINGEEVPIDELDQGVTQIRNSIGRGGSGSISLDQQSELLNYAWDNILTGHAVIAAAKANGINVSDSEARAELDRMIDQRLEQIGAGSTEEEKRSYRAQLRATQLPGQETRALYAQRLRDKITAEARTIEVKVAHVLIKTDARSESAAQRMAQDLARRARAGEDFGQLASKFSEDTGSKFSQGVAGWASAAPAPPPPTDPKAKKDPNAPTSFVPEFTAAALRLTPGKTSDPVRSEFGYHILKSVEERQYKPPAPPKGQKPDAKKDKEAIDSYKQQVVTAIVNGLVEEYKRRAKIEAVSPWLRGHLAEEASQRSLMQAVQAGKPPTQTDRMAPVIKAYEEALKQGGLTGGKVLAFKLAKLYDQSSQYQKAFDTIKDFTGSEPDLEIFRGDLLERLNRKSDAVAAYQKAAELAFDNPAVHGQLVDKFKKLGRKDLADKAAATQREQQARQDKLRKQQEAENKRQQDAFLAQQKKAEADRKAQEAKDKAAKAGKAPSGAGNAPATNSPVPGNAPGNAPAAGNAP